MGEIRVGSLFPLLSGRIFLGRRCVAHHGGSVEVDLDFWDSTSSPSSRNHLQKPEEAQIRRSSLQRLRQARHIHGADHIDIDYGPGGPVWYRINGVVCGSDLAVKTRRSEHLTSVYTKNNLFVRIFKSRVEQRAS